MLRKTGIAMLSAAAALSLALSAQASAGTLDQSQTSDAMYQGVWGPDLFGTDVRRAQTFTAGLSGQLDQVDVLLRTFDEVSGPLTVEIRNVSGGVPGNDVLATAQVPRDEVPVGIENRTFIPVVFSPTVPVEAGTQYAIVASAGGSDVYDWFAGRGNPYPAGAAYSSISSGPWSVFAPDVDTDWAFKTYVAPWDFTGFFGPVDNAKVNRAKAGSSIPVKFSLDGDQGLDVLDGAPRFTVYECDPDAEIEGDETTSTANNGLKYDAATHTYTYVWKTSKNWKGKCGTFTLKLDDGTTHTAQFQFK